MEIFLTIEPRCYPIEDAENEKKYGFSLAGSLVRAHENKNKLLHGYCIFVSPSVSNPSSLKEIVECNGGSFFTPNLKKPSFTQCPKSENYILVSCDQDEKYWNSFIKAVKKQDKETESYVVTKDWILTSVLRQSIPNISESKRDGFILKA